MEINIISYTEEQLAALSASQLREVRTAQLKKNQLEDELAERLVKEKQRMLENGTYYSPAYGQLILQLKQTYGKKVETLRKSLLFYLHYSTKPQEEEYSPYPLDYSLSETERYYVVKAYYETTYPDPVERLNAFKADTNARKYLGELYGTLHDVFLQAT